MTTRPTKELCGLELLRQPATLALAHYLNDLHAVIGFKAFLWGTIVKSDSPRENIHGNQRNPKVAASQMKVQSPLLEEMIFAKGVNSFLTYLADLMTLIFQKFPKKLPSNKQVSYRFCIEHHLAGDLISALAEETVLEKTHQGLDALAEYFGNNLDLILFTKERDLVNARLCVDLRNIITHNRGVLNSFFAKRHPQFAGNIGKRVMIDEELRGMLNNLGHCVRKLDVRAVEKFELETIQPVFEDSASSV